MIPRLILCGALTKPRRRSVWFCRFLRWTPRLRLPGARPSGSRGRQNQAKCLARRLRRLCPSLEGLAAMFMVAAGVIAFGLGWMEVTP